MKWLLVLVFAFFIGFNAQVGYKLYINYNLASFQTAINAVLALSNFCLGGLFIALLLRQGNREGG